MTEQQWANELLRRLGIEPTDGAVKALIGWAHAEGGHWNNQAKYNPLNTTLTMPGAASMNTVGVKAYTSWDQGLDATVKTLHNGLYDGILAALRGGEPARVADAIGASPWAGRGNATYGGLVSKTIAAASGKALGAGQGAPVGLAGTTADAGKAGPSTALKLLLTLALIIAGAGLAVAGLARLVGVRNPVALAGAAGRARTGGAA